MYHHGIYWRIIKENKICMISQVIIRDNIILITIYVLIQSDTQELLPCSQWSLLGQEQKSPKFLIDLILNQWVWGAAGNPELGLCKYHLWPRVIRQVTNTVTKVTSATVLIQEKLSESSQPSRGGWSCLMTSWYRRFVPSGSNMLRAMEIASILHSIDETLSHVCSSLSEIQDLCLCQQAVTKQWG